MTERRPLDPKAGADARPGGEPNVHVAPQLLDPMIGLRLGEYEVRNLLALGGMSRVYRAVHRELPSLQRAVKVLIKPNKEPERAAFFREARAASQVHGINIVALHDFGRMPTIQREPYLMMELLRGETLADMLEREEELDFLDALELTQQVLAALTIIHEAGLVHRDIKPSNLFLVPDPQNGVLLKVLDLGLSAAMPNGLSLERDVHPGMTPKYASPEQFGEFAVGPASDVYSLGVVLYEMITGRMLFPVMPTEPAINHGHRRQNEAPESPATYVPDLPNAVTEFVLSLLEKDPKARPSVATAMNQVKRLRERFKDAHDGPTQVRTIATAPSSKELPQLNQDQIEQKPVVLARGNKLAIFTGAGALVALIASVVAWVSILHRGPDQPETQWAVGLAQPAEKPDVPTPKKVVPTEHDELAPLPSLAQPPKGPSVGRSDPRQGKEVATTVPEPVSAEKAPKAIPTRTVRAPLPRREPPVTKSTSMTSSRQEPDCTDASFNRSAYGLRTVLSDTSNPEILAIKKELDSALASSDCRRVQGALNRIAKLAGEPRDE